MYYDFLRIFARIPIAIREEPKAICLSPCSVYPYATVPSQPVTRLYGFILPPVLHPTEALKPTKPLTSRYTPITINVSFQDFCTKTIIFFIRLWYSIYE